MRCLTLAEELRTRGASCVFICRPHKGNICGLIRERGFKVLELPDTQVTCKSSAGEAMGHAHWLGTSAMQDAYETLALLQGTNIDWLVADHYCLGATWERALRQACRRILVIDDLADRLHECDILLDQNLGRKEEDYAELVPEQCARLVGPCYALVRQEFAQLRLASLARRMHGGCRNLLVTMGGVDKNNATSDVLAGLDAADLPDDIQVTVVLGASAPWKDAVRERAKVVRFATEVLVNVSNMAELMRKADLAIGAAGSTSWERCCMGLPTIQVVLADNQVGIASALETSKAAISISTDELPHSLAPLIFTLLQSTSRLTEMSYLASQVTDGLGAFRVATELAQATL